MFSNNDESITSQTMSNEVIFAEAMSEIYVMSREQKVRNISILFDNEKVFDIKLDW